MRPSLTQESLPYGIVMDTVLLGERPPGESIGMLDSDAADDRLSQLRVRARGTARRAHTVLFRCVPHVVLLRSEKEMRWTHAVSNVTAVKDEQAPRIAIGEEPGSAVGTLGPTLWGVEPPVPEGVTTTNPEPARLRLQNMRPESLCQRTPHIWIVP